MTFDFTDDDRDTLRVLPSTPDAVLIAIGSRRQEPRVSDVRIPLDRVEEVIAGIRDAARTAAARQTTGQDDTGPAPWIADGRHGPTPTEMADRRIPTCYVQFMGGAHCATAPAVGQPAEAQATDDLPARLRAILTARYANNANPFSRLEVNFKGPDGWPAAKPVSADLVAETLRELLDAPTLGRCVSSHCVEGDHVIDLGPADPTVEDER